MSKLQQSLIIIFLLSVTLTRAVASSIEDLDSMTSQHRQLADSSGGDAWYARLVGSLLSSAAKATSTAHLPTTVAPLADNDASSSSSTTPAPSDGFLSGSINPANWFAARTHSPTITASSSSSNQAGGGVSSWWSTVTNYFGGYRKQASSDGGNTTDDGDSVPSFTPVYGKRNKYSPRVPYFNTLLPQHQSAVPCIALSLTPDKKYMYAGNAERPWEAQAAALKRCYHDGQEVCDLSGVGVVSTGSCIAVAKAEDGVLYPASSQLEEDEGLSIKQLALSTCAHASQQVCTVEYFDCPV